MPANTVISSFANLRTFLLIVVAASLITMVGAGVVLFDEGL
jgi:hypothetical protein